MKVCHLTVAHKADDLRIFKKECVSLASAGLDVCIVAPGSNDIVMQSIRVYGVSICSNPICRILFGARKIYKKALSLDADVYHFHDIELFTYGVKLKRKGKKVIFDSHEDWVGYAKEICWLPNVIKIFFSFYIKRMYTKHLNDFDAVISVSPNIVDNLKKMSSKVFMVGNYPIVDNNIGQFSFEDYSRRQNIIVYSGTVYDNSNQLSITHAIAEIKGTKYYIVGNANDATKEQIKAIDKLGKVTFCGYVRRDEVLKFYGDAIVGVAIFDYNPHSGGQVGTLGSNKLFEYMYAGLPVICSDQLLWKERVVGKYHCGITVQPGNNKQIKTAIEYIVNNKSEAYKMGVAGRQAVLKEFNWETQEKELLKVYKILSDNEKC